MDMFVILCEIKGYCLERGILLWVCPGMSGMGIGFWSVSRKGLGYKPFMEQGKGLNRVLKGVRDSNPMSKHLYQF